MPTTQFVSFDDGASYHNVSQIKRFEHDDENNGTRFYMLNGDDWCTSRPHADVVKMLGGCVNLWY